MSGKDNAPGQNKPPQEPAKPDVPPGKENGHGPGNPPTPGKGRKVG